MGLTRLGAIDRMRKLHAKFREQWIGASPCLVLADGYMLWPSVTVDNMLAKMDEHGDPVGMVGIAWLAHSKRVGILQMVFRAKADTAAKKAVQRAANEALTAWQDYVKSWQGK